MRRTGRTPIESNAAEVHIQPFRPFGPLYTEGIDNIYSWVVGSYGVCYDLTIVSVKKWKKVGIILV